MSCCHWRHSHSACHTFSVSDSLVLSFLRSMPAALLPIPIIILSSWMNDDDHVNNSELCSVFAVGRWPKEDRRRSSRMAPNGTERFTDVMMECRRSARNVRFLSCYRCSRIFSLIPSHSLTFSFFLHISNAYSYAYESSSHTRPTHVPEYYKILTYC